MSTSVPATPEEFLASPLSQVPWYYSVEVFPGLVARGSFPDDLVMLPRLLTRHAEVTGHSCLDIGSMEGLLPTLLARRGASRVVATDAVPHALTDWKAANNHPRSTISAAGPYDGVVWRDDLDAIDLWASVQNQPGHGPAIARDAHQLHLDDWE